MKVLFVTSEAVPFIASGGLADVSGALPRSLRNHKIACRVILPLYSDIPEEYKENMKYIGNFQVPLAWRSQYCGLFESTVNNVKYYFLDNEYYFKRDGIYGFYDDAERFAFFSRAVLEAIPHLGFTPEIVHCNDWQSALTPVYLKLFYQDNELYQNIRSIFTIHNIQYQGKYGEEILESVLGIDPKYADVLEYDDCLNFVKGAIATSDRVTTVSPTYAKELHDPWFAHSMDRLISQYSSKVSGILNGIDIKEYDPANDDLIFKKFSATNIKDRKKNKTELLKSLNMEEIKDSMLVSMVTRLVSHKGLDLVKYAFEEMLSLNTQFIILGTGDYLYVDFFQYMQEKYPERVRMITGFIPKLARQIYAGTDVFLMPSKTEPCGLAQMVACRYGALPVVREIGGLKDTINDEGGENPNGFTFKTYNAHDMLGAVARAKGAFSNPKHWQAIQTNAMKFDFSWAKSSKEYIELYESVL